MFCFYKTNIIKVKMSVLQIVLGIYESWKQIPEVTFFLDHFYKNIKEIQSDCLYWFVT